MADLVSQNVYELTVHGRDTVSSQSIINRWFVDTIGAAAPPPTFQELLTTFRSWWRNNILPQVHQQYVVDKYACRHLTDVEPVSTSPRRVRYLFDLGEELTGDASIDFGARGVAMLPTYVAVSFNQRTGVLGRSYRGGKRFACIPEADTNAEGNRLDPAILTNWQTVAGNIPGGKSLGHTDWFFFFGIMPGTPYGFTDPPHVPPWEWFTRITTVLVNPYVGSQVSRKQGNTPI